MRPVSTLNGARVGGKSKDLRDGVVTGTIGVTRSKTKGLGFAGYLKKGVEGFVKDGYVSRPATRFACATHHGRLSIPVADRADSLMLIRSTQTN